MKTSAALSRPLSLLVILCLAREAGAQRAFQKFWMERYAEQKPPVVVEDDLPPLDPAQERRLFAPEDPRAGALDIRIFPGTTARTEDTSPSLKVYAAGALALESGSSVAALKAFKEAVDLEPDNLWLRLRLAEAAMMVNDLARAKSSLEEALQRDPGNVRAMLRLAEVFALRQKYDEAKSWYGRVLQEQPRNIDALQALMQMAWEIDRSPEQTKKYAQDILFTDDRNPNALLHMAEASAFSNEASAAADYYERLIKLRPNLLERLAEVARRLAAMGQNEQARILFERAMVIAPEQPALRTAWEDSVRRSGGETAVRAAWEGLLNRSPSDFRVRDLFAEYLRRQEDWSALRESRQKDLALNPKHVPALLDLADDHLRRGEIAQATEWFERAARATPNDPDVQRRIGEAYIAAGKLADAESALLKARALNPRDTDVLGSLAALAEKQGKRPEAEGFLREALEETPASGPLLKQLGTFYLRGKDRQKARELFQQVLAAAPDDLETWVNLAQIYLEDGDGRSLDQLEKQASDTLPRTSPFFPAYGILTQEHGDFERSRRALERALRELPQDIHCRIALARAYVKLEQVDLGVQVLRDGEKASQQNKALARQFREASAQFLTDAQQGDAAIAAWRGLVKEDAGNLAYREGLLDALVRFGRDEEATKELNEVVRSFATKQPRETQLLRAAVLRQRGDAARALSTLLQLEKEHGPQPEILLELAMAAADADEVSLAERTYRRLMDLGAPDVNPLYDTAVNNLAYLFAQRNIRLEEAEKLALEAVALEPQAPHALDTLGWVYFRQGRLQEAQELIEKAAARALLDGEVYTNLGQVYEKLGDSEKARATYEKALKADPKSKVARERRDALAGTKKNPAAGTP